VGFVPLSQYSRPSLLLLFVCLLFCKVLGDIVRVAGDVRDAPSSCLHLVSSEAFPPSNAELRKGLSRPCNGTKGLLPSQNCKAAGDFIEDSEDHEKFVSLLRTRPAAIHSDAVF